MFRSIGRNTKEAIAPLAELASCIERIEILISRVLIPKNRVGRRSSPPRTRQISGQGPYDDYPIVDFVLMASIKEEDELIELLRRIAELVVLGEQRAAQLLHNTDEPKDVEEREALALLEFFYERNTLDLIVGIITGDVFREMIAKKDSSSSLSSLTTTTAPIATTPEYIYLPPIAVAIQAVQTISILLQNVVRATSLYLLLSNNRLGSLIQLSLELYHHAIQKKIPDRSTPNTKEIQQEQYAELSELTTHFISLLKSIALRINAETLQFFLVYPYTEKKRQVSKDEDTSPSPLPPIIEFPLYAKSLSFCSSQYDSFVRITALNICMNLIRASSLEDSSSVITSALPSATTSLTTITPSEATQVLETHPNDSRPITFNDKVPNAATLCNLPAISLQDRLGIMKFICTPTRVEALVSSIFLNVATICTSLEENIQALYVVDERLENLDDSRESTPQEGSNPNFESSFKERGECVRTIRNSAADLEDELYLLNDMLKLGLLGLNEQIVERILTTMIYPQLLQPLHSWLQYYHETPRKSMTITPPFGSDQENIMLSQATTALYVATILFRTVTHKPTLHVIFTALCHPLTPHESKSYIVSRSFSPKEFISYENESMSSYDFRHDVFVDRPPVQDESLAGELSEQQAVFILSPALFALFQSAMSDTNTEWIETKLNPYRSALLSSLSLSKKFPLLSKVAAYLLDSILASLSPAVVNNILQLHDEKESISNDGIFHELMSSLYSNLITESISPSGFATVDFDLIIAHVILCASILNDRSLEASERLVSLEFSKSISFLSHLPQFITEKLLSGNHSKPKDNHPSNQRYGTIVYNLFYGLSNGQFKCVVESLNRLNDTKDSAFIPIANDNSSGDLSSVFVDESRFKAIHEHRNVYVDSVDSVLAILKVATLKNMIKSGSIIAHSHHAEVKSVAQTLEESLRNVLLSCSSFSTGGDFLSPIPKSLTEILFLDHTNDPSFEELALPAAGTVVSFDGKLSFPCVVEITTEQYPLIVDKASCIIADGVRWLSLYLVLFGDYLVLAEPSAEGSHDKGRVLSSCRIQNLQVIEDNPMEIQNASPARRLVFTHTSYSRFTSFPDLFTPLNIESTTYAGGNDSFSFPRSTIDLWFENMKAAQLALNTINSKIERLRSRLGEEIFEKMISLKLDGIPVIVEEVAVQNEDSALNTTDLNEITT